MLREEVLASQILRRLRREMNGAVVGAMEERGIVYHRNYGVSIPTIRSVAVTYAPDHDLALFLFNSSVRELMLSALYIDEPLQVTYEQMYLWSESFTNPEIVENTVSVLFCKAPAALETAVVWLGSDNMYVCYAALLMIAKVVRREDGISPEAVSDIVGRSDGIVNRSDFNPMLATSLASMLSSCVSASETVRADVKAIAERYCESENRLIKYAGEEIGWRIEI